MMIYKNFSYQGLTIVFDSMEVNENGFISVFGVNIYGHKLLITVYHIDNYKLSFDYSNTVNNNTVKYVYFKLEKVERW